MTDRKYVQLGREGDTEDYLLIGPFAAVAVAESGFTGWNADGVCDTGIVSESGIILADGKFYNMFSAIDAVHVEQDPAQADHIRSAKGVNMKAATKAEYEASMKREYLVDVKVTFDATLSFEASSKEEALKMAKSALADRSAAGISEDYGDEDGDPQITGHEVREA